MRKVLFYILVCVLSLPCVAGSMTWVSFESQELSPGRWEYTYEVANIDLSINGQPAAIQEFTLWFDFNLYANLVVTTPAPLSVAWDEIVWQPEPVLGDQGGYDVLVEISNPGITVGQQAKGFSVAFDWLGADTPGSQYYEIINPDTLETLDAGVTIPEPACAIFMIIGAVWMTAKRKGQSI